MNDTISKDLTSIISLLGNKVNIENSINVLKNYMNKNSNSNSTNNLNNSNSTNELRSQSIISTYDNEKIYTILKDCSIDKNLFMKSYDELNNKSTNIVNQISQFALLTLIKTGKYIPNNSPTLESNINNKSDSVSTKSDANISVRADKPDLKVILPSSATTTNNNIKKELEPSLPPLDSHEFNLGLEALNRNNNEQYLNIYYGNHITLLINNQYICRDKLSIIHTTPSVYESFTFVNADYKHDRQVIRYMDSIFLKTLEGKFLYLDDNTLKVSVTTPDEFLIVATPFTNKNIFNPIDEDSTPEYLNLIGEVKVMDSFALLSKSNKKLLCLNKGGTITASAYRVEPSARWKICFSNMPIASDWTLNRGFHTSYVDELKNEKANKHAGTLFKSIPSFVHNNTAPSITSPLLTTLHTFETKLKLSENSDKSLNTLPLEAQDSILTEEMLYALMGIEGKFVKRLDNVDISSPSPTLFHIDSSLLDGSSSHLVSLILPACGYYASICRFIDVHSRYEFGLIHHAFCAALQSLLKEYLILLVQLSAEQLSLQKLHYYLQPSLHTLSRLHRLLIRIQFDENGSVKGGALLNCIFTAMKLDGDSSSASLFSSLLHSCSKPYLEMLEDWLTSGVVHDPHGEFCIIERTDLKKGDVAKDWSAGSYWEDQYQLVEANLLQPLTEYSTKILMIGKYWNVVRDYKKDIKESNRKLEFSLNPRQYAEFIEYHYEIASSMLLQLLLVDMNLISRVKSLKSYFFLEQGDFFIQFYDSVKSELDKSLPEVSLSKVESLLDMAIRTSISNDDIYHDDLHCQLHVYTLPQKLEMLNRPELKINASKDLSKVMSGFESLCFDYTVRWPLSLVLSKKALTKYQFIFRHLFAIKHTENIIIQSWMDLQMLRELNLGPVFSPYFVLRHQMLLFINAISYFMMVEILEPNFLALEAELSNAKTIDELISIHDNFLDKCMKETLLTNQPLFKCLTKIFETVKRFAVNISRVLDTARDKMNIEDNSKPKRLNNARRRQIRNDISSKSIEYAITTYLKSNDSLLAEDGDKFNSLIKEFMKLLTKSYDTHTERLFNCLNYNGYYSNE